MRSKYLTDLYYAEPFPASRKVKYKARQYAGRRGGHPNDFYGMGGFKCAQCRQFVSTDTLLSGVNNRNHCPYCLWSRHLDLFASGDRLAACKAKMQPVGLTLKRSRNKYAQEQDGELMLIHRCIECGKLSINRTAADDEPSSVFTLLDEAARLDPHTLAELISGEIQVLDHRALAIVRVRLLGRS
jgi:hypothetical protein